MIDNDAIACFRLVVADYRRCFWLDGGGGRDWSGHRSYIGGLSDEDVSISYDAGAQVVRRHVGDTVEDVGPDVFEALAQEVDAGPADAQWFGYFGYAARSGLQARPGRDLPDAIWMRPSRVQVFTHPPTPDSDPGSGLVRPYPLAAAREHAYRNAFARVREELHAGNTHGVNLSYRVEVEHDADPVAAYLALRCRNPAPYAGFLQHDVPSARAWLLSSSPERFARIGADRWVQSRPVREPTGPTADHPAHDPGLRAENLMIADLLRNDIGRVAEPGTVSVPQLMHTESRAAVHQVVSTVRGRLRAGISPVEAVHALFPPGSMTGAPKQRTMRVIDEVEDSPRGVYAGAFGRIAGDGEADLGVVTRSLTTDGSGRWTLGTGSGITVHSRVDEELAAAGVEAARLLDVLQATDGDEVPRPVPVH